MAMRNVALTLRLCASKAIKLGRTDSRKPGILPIFGYLLPIGLEELPSL